MNLKKLSIQCLTVVIGMTTLKANANCTPLLDHSVRQLAGEQVDRLCEVYQGQVVMIVNTASKCGFTPQFDGLEALYRKYKDQGFAVLGFPSKDFGNQEYGTEEEAADGDYPSWNFHKYIIDRDGQLVGSFGSFTGPSSRRIARVIEEAL